MTDLDMKLKADLAATIDAWINKHANDSTEEWNHQEIYCSPFLSGQMADAAWAVLQSGADSLRHAIQEGYVKE